MRNGLLDDYAGDGFEQVRLMAGLPDARMRSVPVDQGFFRRWSRASVRTASGGSDLRRVVSAVGAGQGFPNWTAPERYAPICETQ